MDEQLAQQIGERVRFYRTAAQQAKTVTAGLAGISPDYLYQLERGTKMPTIKVMTQLADALGVPVGQLLGDRSEPAKPATKSAATEAIHQAMTGPVLALREAPSLPGLRTRIAYAWNTWQTSSRRYSRIGTLLPAIILDTRLALRWDDHRTAYQCSADLHGLVRTVAKRMGRVDLALLAADRAVHAAEIAEDQLRLAAARWNLTQVLLAGNQAETAEAVALHGIAELQPAKERLGPDALALHGALLLIAAIAAARHGDTWTAYDRLRQAEPLAARTGERNTCWTVFGPTNLAMYRAALAVETGQSAEGLRLAEQVDHSRSPSIERRVASLLDQARGYLQRRDYASALVVLQAVARESPEDMTHRPNAHSALKSVIYGGRRSVAAEAARLAVRVEMPV